MATPQKSIDVSAQTSSERRLIIVEWLVKDIIENIINNLQVRRIQGFAADAWHRPSDEGGPSHSQHLRFFYFPDISAKT
jgi:hypothetical protein